MTDFLKQAARVRPSARQLQWFETGMYGFVHYGVNTYTDREWGTGKEPESVFAPTALDCDQWVRAFKSAGMKGMVLTAKHHDGFCLWPSRHTGHSVANSPFGGDVVREAADACRRGGIKFGFYLSPWDRNNPLYGAPAYNDYFCDQLTELLTGYGDIFCVWFDNACGEGANGVKQVYDFPRYISLVRRYQPNAVIFNDFGPDVRWCGNESGAARHSEWAVVPSELCRYGEVQTGPGPLAGEGDLSYLYNTDRELGALSGILYSRGLTFTPAEIDMSIRPGWFWHEKEEPHPLGRLFQTYLDSVGGNACLNLNVPPDRSGRFDARDVRRLEEFGALLRDEFGQALPCTVRREPGGYPTQPAYTAVLASPRKTLRYVELREDLARGQRVESFRITAEFDGGGQYPLFQGTTIGNRRICPLASPLAGQNPLLFENIPPVKRLRVQITAARDEAFLSKIRLY
jgi:alpha-L-fucosidase